VRNDRVGVQTHKNMERWWPQKLKDDQRAVKADIAVLVSEVLPKDCKHFGQYDGIWISNAQCAVSLAVALRSQLVEIAMSKLAAVGKNEKMEILYQYLSGAEFKQRVEAIVEAFMAMQTDLQEERRITERRWARTYFCASLAGYPKPSGKILIEPFRSAVREWHAHDLIASWLCTVPRTFEGDESLAFVFRRELVALIENKVKYR
jgi:hypothetical protein